MKLPKLTRREGLRQALRAGLYGAAVQLWPSQAQDMASGQLLSVAKMIEPLTTGKSGARSSSCGGFRRKAPAEESLQVEEDLA